jgi:hypothetical protein
MGRRLGTEVRRRAPPTRVSAAAKTHSVGRTDARKRPFRNGHNPSFGRRGNEENGFVSARAR